MTKELIAKVCHEANRAYCETIHDFSQKTWDEASQWQRDSAIKGVKFRLDEGGESSAQHEAWVADKKADGWKYGPVKDAELKTHPCMVPYAELPNEQKAKDALFIAVVDALAPYLN